MHPFRKQKRERKREEQLVLGLLKGCPLGFQQVKRLLRGQAFQSQVASLLLHPSHYLSEGFGVLPEPLG